MREWKHVIIALCLGLIFVFSAAINSHAYDSILTFGDSSSDNGFYGDGASPALTNSNDIYGITRFSNGPVWVEYLAGVNHYNVPLLDMAYGGAGTGYNNPGMVFLLSTGVPYPGVTSDPSKIPYYESNTGLLWQVSKYKDEYGTISADTLITIWAGTNDRLFNSALVTGTAAANNIGSAIQDLINIGGRSFIIPYSSNASDTWLTSFSERLNQVIAALNSSNLNKGVNIDLLYLNNFVGTVDVDNGIYSGAWLERPVGDNSTYFWYDKINGAGLHLTTEVQEQLADYVADTVPVHTPVPIPAAIWLLGSGLIGLVGIRKRFKK